jgi:hypothetical protein
MSSMIEDIEREADALARGKVLPAHAKPSYIALCEYVRGLPVDQVCPYCGGAISVEPRGAAWLLGCPCGRCKDTWRGF